MLLSLKERKILFELDRDARQTNKAIGKTVRIPKETVQYIRQKLLKEGYIHNIYTVLNTVQLGYLHFNALIRFRGMSEASRNEFLKFCTTHQQVIWCATCTGAWDISISFLTKAVKEYDAFISEIFKKYGANIQDHTISLLVESPTYSRAYLLPHKEGVEFTYRTGQTSSVDILEHNILCALARNADFTIIALAESLHTTVDIVRARIRKLHAAGIIQGTRAALDVEKLGYAYFRLIIQVSMMNPDQEMRFREYCRRNPHVTFFIKYIGPAPFQLELEIQPDQIYTFIESFRRKFPDMIKGIELLKLHEHKLNYYPFAPL